MDSEAGAVAWLTTIVTPGCCLLVSPSNTGVSVAAAALLPLFPGSDSGGVLIMIFAIGACRVFTVEGADVTGLVVTISGGGATAAAAPAAVVVLLFPWPLRINAAPEDTGSKG